MKHNVASIILSQWTRFWVQNSLLIKCPREVSKDIPLMKHNVASIILSQWTRFWVQNNLLIKCPRENAGGLSREYVLHIPSVS